MGGGRASLPSPRLEHGAVSGEYRPGTAQRLVVVLSGSLSLSLALCVCLSLVWKLNDIVYRLNRML